MIVSCRMASIAPSSEDADRTVVLDSDRRLMITKIVNENFKSYAGKQELGPFHKVILILVKILTSISDYAFVCCVVLTEVFLDSWAKWKWKEQRH